MSNAHERTDATAMPGSKARRTFARVAGASALVAAVRPSALRAERVYRIGVLENVSAERNAENLAALRRGLSAYGYVEGRNLVIEYRSAEGRAERFPALAAELGRWHPDLVVARGTPATLAARDATSRIPVVMATMGDPRAFVASLAAPGGNVTGVMTFSTELVAKRIELLRELVPRLARVALLHNLANPASPPEWEAFRAAADAMRLDAVLLDVGSPEAIDAAFARAVAAHADGLVVGADGLLQDALPRIVALAARTRIPAAYPAREFVEAGGLLAYSPDYPALYEGFARTIDKILKGARPAELPVERPARFQLVVNRTAAHALGLELPAALLMRADTVLP